MIEYLATVITNLLSAIPWIGQDFVQFVTIFFLVLSVFSLSVFYMQYFSLPTIGIVNSKALRGAKARSPQDKTKYSNISSQFIAMLVGFIDGDGYIKITKTVKGFISMEIVISLDIRDKDLVEYLYSVLIIGRISYNKSTVKYIIGRVDLQEILFPLLLHHNIYFLTDTRRSQYSLALYILSNNIVKYSDITPYLELVGKNIPILPLTPLNYLNLSFFIDWVVGFTIAEGSFYKKSNGEFYFSIRQRTHNDLFIAFQLLFNTARSIDMSSKGHSKFNVSSVKDLTTVINFFSFSNTHPLVGYKKEQYNKWIDLMRTVNRCKEVTFPNKLFIIKTLYEKDTSCQLWKHNLDNRANCEEFLES